MSTTTTTVTSARSSLVTGHAMPATTPPPSSSSSSSHVQRVKLHAKRSSATPPSSQAGGAGGAAGSAANNLRNPLVLVALVFLTLLLTLLVMAFFAFAPLLCVTSLGLLYLVGLYLSTESNWRWHDAQEFENRFWTLTAFLFSTAVLYIQDSPIALGRWNATFGMLLVVAFTSGVHFLDRFLHRKEISRKPRLNVDASLPQHLVKVKETAEEKAKLVTDSVARIDRMYLPSTINNMLNLSQVKAQEQTIFRVLAESSKDELNYIINNVRLALVFYKVKDHSSTSRPDQSRTRILDLLCSQRLADLTITSRAILLDALMVMKLSAHPMGEKWVRTIILKTAGDDLSKLKTYTDAKGDFHSLHKLIFNDIRDPTIRNDLLNHIRREADIQTAHMRLGTRRAMQRRQHAWRKVLSDVDDTLYSSGGRYPAGIDTRYPRHAVYPGVLSFYRELDMGTAGPDDWRDDHVGNLVFLSARPHVYKDMSEKKSYAKFAALYENKGMHTLPTMLAGSLQSGRAFMVQGDLEPMARKKFENFGEYYQLYPEFTHVFVGDNGQGDVRAAELIVEKYGSSALEAAFFHLVQPVEKTFGYHSSDDLERWRKMNIVFFHTYVGAAVEAYRLRKIRAVAIVRQYRGVDGIYQVDILDWTTMRRRQRRRVQGYFPEESLIAYVSGDVSPIPRSQLKYVRVHRAPLGRIYAAHTPVSTPFGDGRIVKFRVEDEIYVVAIDGNSSSSTSGGASSLKLTGYFTPDAILPIKPSCEDAENSVSPRMFAGVRSSIGYITKRLSTFVPGSTPKPLFSAGTTVETPFGRGIALGMRPFDRVYDVQLLRAGMTKTTVLVQERSLHLAPVSPSRSFFSMLGIGSSGGIKTASINGSRTPPLVGRAVATPYGKGIIVKFRAAEQIYEVELLDWTLANNQKVVAFLTKSFVRGLVESEVPELSLDDPKAELAMSSAPSSSRGGFFQLFRYGFSSNGIEDVSTPPPSDKNAQTALLRRFDTPFGVGTTTMDEPKSGTWQVTLDNPNLAGVVAFVQANAVTELPPPTHVRRNTLEFLGYPFSYLRGGWNSTAPPSENGSFIDTAFTGALSSGPKFSVGALVATPFGDGVVTLYRQHDCVYHVQVGLIKCFFQASALAHPMRGTIGEPVSTIFGSGILKTVRPNDGVHVVTLRHAMLASMEIRGYLQAQAVTGAIPAARGDVVSTPFGAGVVVKYRAEDDFYCVALEWDPRRRTHVTAFIRSQDVVRAGPVEKTSSGCCVM
ncbi:hypothetical protein P43SY_002362 [Pythium insidiosum]|uniref:Uncharacterized protein n=1 Tax=Pythium insidiosum TaxID=114742 RepID=A0AAD5M9F5_PYTIN|nr:hypothetical protein P43SY_002362 [Pythium insidiosum]